MEVMLSAVKATFDGKVVGEFGSFLKTICQRRVVDYHRSRERHPKLDPLPDEHEGEDGGPWGHRESEPDETEMVALLDAVARVLASRSPLHQRVIRLYGPGVAGFEDLTAAQVCDRIAADGSSPPGMRSTSSSPAADRTRYCEPLCRTTIAAMEGIERRAEELLAEVPEWIWDGDVVPVPVEDIADSHCGLLVRDIDDMRAAPGCPAVADGQALSGLLLPSLGEIWVSADEARQWPPRRRFTIGHELGHWILHQSEQTALFCRHGQVDAEAGDAAADRPPLDPIEEEANHFAAALLMPASLIRREYERTGGDFGQLCDLFNSSGAAMGRRLHQVI